MTIWNPPISEVGAAVQARTHRKVFGAFIQGEGLLKKTDLQVTGDPSALKMNISMGGAMLQLPDGTFDVVFADTAEARTLNTAGSGTRLDLIYAGIKSKEFGDSVNAADIFYKANPSIGSTTPPAPDTMAATYPIARVSVPAGATRGSDCTITMLSATTAPTRDGGFTLADTSIQLPVVKKSVGVATSSGGYVTLRHYAPFTPSIVDVVVNGPLGGVTAVPCFAGVDSIDGTNFRCRFLDQDGNGLPSTQLVDMTSIAFP